MRIKFKFLIIFMVMLMPNFVRASEVNFKCPEEVIIGGNIVCSVDLNTNTKVKGILGKYKYDDVFSYVKTINSSKWELLAGNVNGMSLISLDGASGQGNIAMVVFTVSSDAKIGEEYDINFNEVNLSDGNKDISVGNLNAVVKVVGISDIFKYITVNDKEIELTEGIVNNTVEVDYNTTSVDVKAILNNENYSFAEGYGPMTVKGLEVGDNEVYLKVVDDGGIEILTYRINIKRLPKVGEKITSNPKTGVLSVFVVGLIFVISVITLFGFGKHLTKGDEI